MIDCSSEHSNVISVLRELTRGERNIADLADDTREVASESIEFGLHRAFGVRLGIDRGATKAMLDGSCSAGTMAFASLEQVSQSMYEISVCLSNSSLCALSQTPFWPAIAAASRDQIWWYRRVEHLVGCRLEYRSGDWASAYCSLDHYGFVFSSFQNYANDLLVSILLEIKAEIEENERPLSCGIAYGISLGLVEPVVRHLNNPAVTFDSILEDACSCNRVDLAKLAVSLGGDLTPSSIREVLIDAATWGHAAILEYLLAFRCPGPPTLREASLVKRAIQNGKPEALRVLLADKRVMAARPPVNATLHLAIELEEMETTRLLASADGDVASISSARRQRQDIIEMLLSYKEI